MSIKQLDNLVKIGELKTEPPDESQIDGFVGSARRRLADLEVKELSVEGRFSAAYAAAHSLALAALRWHGYRSDKRYIVFQCLQYTVGLDNAKWRVLDKCHKQRNLAEYEGHLEVSEQLLDELISITREVLALVESMGPIES